MEFSNDCNGIQSPPHKVKEGVKGLCVLCKKTASHQCQRCQDHYCSQECQRKDWQSHRYICFPMPSLVATSAEPSVAKTPTLNHARPQSKPEERTLPGRDGSGPGGAGNPRPPPNLNQTLLEEIRSPFPVSAGCARCPYPELPHSAPMPPHNTNVQILGFRSPNRCYVQSLDKGIAEAMAIVLRQVSVLSKGAQPLLKLPNAGDHVLLKQGDNVYRARIIHVRNNSVFRVLKCDYGKIIYCKFADLFIISAEIMALRSYPILVQLADVTYGELTDRIAQYLSRFEGMSFRMNYSRPDKVHLYHLDTGCYLNEELSRVLNDLWANRQMGEKSPSQQVRPQRGNEINYAGQSENAAPMNRRSDPWINNNNNNSSCNNNNSSSGNNNSSGNHNNSGSGSPNKRNENKEMKSGRSGGGDTPTRQLKELTLNARPTAEENNSGGEKKSGHVLKPPFVQRAFPRNGVNLNAAVLDNSLVRLGYIGCVLQSDIRHLGAIQRYLNAYRDSMQPYKPCMQEFCLARFEKGFYRARVTGQKDSEYTVVYIDFTNEGTVSEKEIRPYPSDLIEDCRTNLCLINGLPQPLSLSQQQVLVELTKFQSRILIDRVVEIRDDVVIIECETLLAQLAEVDAQ